MIEEAIEKLSKEPQKLSQKAEAVSGAVREALKKFCLQNAEFAQAVAQSEKTVADCLEYVVKGCGSSLSDITAYERAAEFYFSGAKVHCHMTIDLGDGGFSGEEEAAKAVTENKGGKRHITLDLDELL